MTRTKAFNDLPRSQSASHDTGKQQPRVIYASSVALRLHHL